MFIDKFLQVYKLDPCHHFISPGLSWDVMLKMSGVKLEKIIDIGIYLLIEKRLRGGISYIDKRYSKANNKYMLNYDPTKPSKYIEYLDENNLCGWAMSGYLPYGGFKWLKNADNFNVSSINEKTLIGYIHVLHNDYPLAPERLAIPYDMLSNYCKKNADEYGIKVW